MTSLLPLLLGTSKTNEIGKQSAANAVEAEFISLLKLLLRAVQ